MQDELARTSLIPLVPCFRFDRDFKAERCATDYKPDENP
jgi:hypothetical protein